MKKDAEKQIIEAARQLFFEKGFAATTVRDIAGKAEVNLALLHYYFRTKDNIFEIVFKDAFAFLFKKLNKALSAKVDYKERIKLIIIAYVTTAAKQPQLASFIVHEFATNPTFVWKIISSYEGKPEINRNYELFFDEIRQLSNKGIICLTDPRVLFIDIMSLSLYPFIAQNFLTNYLYKDSKAAFNQMIKDRSEHIYNLIIKNIET